MLYRKGVKEKQCKKRGVKTTTTLELGTVQYKNKLSTYLVIWLPHYLVQHVVEAWQY